jgi:hypothetical protein
MPSLRDSEFVVGTSTKSQGRWHICDFETWVKTRVQIPRFCFQEYQERLSRGIDGSSPP